MVTLLPRGARGGDKSLGPHPGEPHRYAQWLNQKEGLCLSGQTKSSCSHEDSHTQSLAVAGMGEVGFLHQMAEFHQHAPMSSKGV